jgi:hypothetical protein
MRAEKPENSRQKNFHTRCPPDINANRNAANDINNRQQPKLLDKIKQFDPFFKNNSPGKCSNYPPGK